MEFKNAGWNFITLDESSKKDVGGLKIGANAHVSKNKISHDPNKANKWTIYRNPPNTDKIRGNFGAKKNPNGSFEVLGRFDNSDIRGCNLMVI